MRDAAGEVFGMLTVIRGPYQRRGKWVVDVACDCGEIREERNWATVNHAHTRSCGCLRKAGGGARERFAAATSSKFCALCYDLPHRRPATGCPRCGEGYEAEPELRAVYFLRKLEVREVV